jgi:hypothetical protein
MAYVYVAYKGAKIGYRKAKALRKCKNKKGKAKRKCRINALRRG